MWILTEPLQEDQKNGGGEKGVTFRSFNLQLFSPAVTNSAPCWGDAAHSGVGMIKTIKMINIRVFLDYSTLLPC